MNEFKTKLTFEVNDNEYHIEKNVSDLNIYELADQFFKPMMLVAGYQPASINELFGDLAERNFEFSESWREYFNQATEEETPAPHPPSEPPYLTQKEIDDLYDNVYGYSDGNSEYTKKDFFSVGDCFKYTSSSSAAIKEGEIFVLANIVDNLIVAVSIYDGTPYNIGYEVDDPFSITIEELDDILPTDEVEYLNKKVGD